jgi:phage shock protein E
MPRIAARPVLFLAILTALTAARVFAAEHTKDSLATVKQNITEKKGVLIDVREQSEWNVGHIDGAILLPLSTLGGDDDAQQLAQQLPKDKLVYLHCASGRRCLKAADVLIKHGYQVRALQPGYQELIDAGFPKAK